jgi:murein L,D-transpeptidase YafK
MKIIAVITLSFSLIACNTISATQYSHNDPKRGQVLQTADTYSKGASLNAPVLIRIIKESKELELWKLSTDKTYILIKIYPICAASGILGPKKSHGDMQAPEGFYSITKSQLNPFSKEHLSFNTGFPNQRDKAHGYSGDALMIHGGCRSAGCYAITDASMEELYAAVRDALDAGQSSVQLQIYPFRMSDWRMLMVRSDPNYEFWRELKAGWDYFEANKISIPVVVKDKQYYIERNKI